MWLLGRGNRPSQDLRLRRKNTDVQPAWREGTIPVLDLSRQCASDAVLVFELSRQCVTHIPSAGTFQTLCVLHRTTAGAAESCRLLHSPVFELSRQCTSDTLVVLKLSRQCVHYTGHCRSCRNSARLAQSQSSSYRNSECLTQSSQWSPQYTLGYDSVSQGTHLSPSCR